MAIDGAYIRHYSKDPNSTKQKVERDNELLYPGLELISIKFPSASKRPDKFSKEKRYTTIVFNMATLRMAANIVTKGVVEVGSYRTVRI